MYYIIKKDFNLNKICDNTIDEDDFSSDEHPNFFVSKELYITVRPLFSRLFSITLIICGRRCFFSQGGITMRQHCSRIGDDLLEFYAIARQIHWIWKDPLS